MTRHISPNVICSLMIGCGIAVAQTSPVATVVQQYTFAPVGVVTGQIMRVNMSITGDGTSSCMGNLSFVNSDGTTVKSQDVAVKAGETMSYSLQMSDIPSATGSAVVRGLVKIERQVGPAVAAPGAPTVRSRLSMTPAARPAWC